MLTNLFAPDEAPAADIESECEPVPAPPTNFTYLVSSSMIRKYTGTLSSFKPGRDILIDYRFDFYLIAYLKATSILLCATHWHQVQNYAKYS